MQIYVHIYIYKLCLLVFLNSEILFGTEWVVLPAWVIKI